MDKKELQLPNGYRAPIEYKDYILAEKDFEYSESKKQYATWFKNDRGFVLGHYFTERKAAEEDFTIRTGLVNQNKLFNADELAVIYKALKDFDAAGNFDYDDKQLCSSIENIREKLEALPNEDIDKYIKISVLIIEPDKEPYVKRITNDLYVFQDEVKGYIEVIHPFSDGDAVLVCNEQGKVHGLPLNRVINNDVIAGTFIIANVDGEGNFASLTDKQISKYEGKFKAKEYGLRGKDSFEQSVDKVVKNTQPSNHATHTEITR